MYIYYSLSLANLSVTTRPALQAYFRFGTAPSRAAGLRCGDMHFTASVRHRHLASWASATSARARSRARSLQRRKGFRAGSQLLHRGLPATELSEGTSGAAPRQVTAAGLWVAFGGVRPR